MIGLRRCPANILKLVYGAPACLTNTAWRLGGIVYLKRRLHILRSAASVFAARRGMSGRAGHLTPWIK